MNEYDNCDSIVEGLWVREECFLLIVEGLWVRGEGFWLIVEGLWVSGEGFWLIVRLGLGLPVSWPATNSILEKTICSRPLRSVPIFFHFLVGVTLTTTQFFYATGTVTVAVIASLS